MKRWVLSKAFSFDAAHFIPGHQGKCKNVHGHTWKGDVSLVTGELDEMGMVIDFAEVKKVLAKILDQIDHQFLNNHFKNPTCELIAQWIHDEIKNGLPENFNGRILSVIVHETEGNACEFSDL